MVAYESKVMQDEDDTLNFSSIRKNSNTYSMKGRSYGYDYSTFIPVVGHLWDTVIPENTHARNNKIPEYRYLVLSSLCTDDAKYRIY